MDTKQKILKEFWVKLKKNIIWRNNEIIENHINDLVGEIIEKYCFTQKELEAMLYHISYDREIVSDDDLKEYGLYFTLNDSWSAIVKLNKLLNNK